MHLTPAPLAALDEQQFGALVEPYRYELRVHCYRLLGSALDAEDLVQETFLRAWRRRATYSGQSAFTARSPLRAWLYRIATNACFDALDQRPRRALPRTRERTPSAPDAPIPPDVREPVWLEPFPDDLPGAEPPPEAHAARREHVTLAFVAALHLLPPRQRAVLILRDVLEWQADETAALLDMTVPAVKSALHRARTTLAQQHAPPESPAVLDDAARAQLARYVRAWEAADVPALLALLRADATFSMPPIPSWYHGRDAIGALVARTVFGGDARGRWRLLPTRANAAPAFGLYRRAPEGDAYAAYGIQVLTLAADGIADVITFRVPGLFRAFGLAETLP